MTAEIKEILDKLKYIVDFSIIEHDTSFNSDNVEESVCLLISNECQLLLDYITNIQQLYENGLKVNQNSHKYITELEMNNAILKEDLDKANDIIKKDRQFYKCRMDEYAKLKKENERLREKVNNLEMFKYNTHNDKTKTVSTITKSYKNEYEDYKSRCEKTIELYKKCKEEDYCILSIKMYEILIGSDENE